MGQAFIALADDATGSETNPAGLTALVSPQVFFEGRVIGNIFRSLAPTETSIEYRDFRDVEFSPTFLSVVVPFRNWAFAAYRQDLAHYAATLDQPTVTVPGVYFILPGIPQPVNVSAYQSDIRVNATNYGFSVASRWGERVNLGMSVRGVRFAYSAEEVQSPDQLNPFYRVGSGDTEAVLMRINGTSWEFSWVGGFIYKPVEQIRLAGVYRSGSRHHFPAVFNENLYLSGSGEPIRTDIPDFEINIPDRYGIGVAVLPIERLTLTLDLLRVEYGDMTTQFIDYIQEEFQDDYGFENGNEIHVGAEYTLFWGGVPISLRGGFYTDADNTLHFLGDPATNDGIRVSPTTVIPIDQVFDHFPVFQSALFPKVGRDYHGTFGVGLTWLGHLQTDFAADLSRDTDYVVFSVLYNF